MRSRITILIASVGVVTACGGPASPPIGDAVAREYVEVVRTGDRDRAEALFVPTAVWEDRATGGEARGAPEVVEYLLGVHDWTSTLFYDATAIHAMDDRVTIEWAIEGRTRATGSEEGARWFRTEGATILELEGERIVRGADYANPAELIVARGGRVVFPDGTELTLPDPERAVDAGEEPDSALPGTETGGGS